MRKQRTEVRKQTFFLCLLIFFVQAVTVANEEIYKPEWESLQKHPVPQWFRDAKFGIYFHLGPYSVPAYNSEWYSCLMYKPNHKVFKYHKEKYGDQSEFGYKDFIPMLTLENFNAEALADLFQPAQEMLQ